MRKNCDIIKDLIPMYVEKLTREDSNCFIKEHLTSCEDCTNYLRNTERNLPNRDSLDIDEGKNDKRLMVSIKHRINRMKFFAVLTGVLIGIGISLMFFNLALVGLMSFLLLIVLLIYLLNNNEQ